MEWAYEHDIPIVRTCYFNYAKISIIKLHIIHPTHWLAPRISQNPFIPPHNSRLSLLAISLPQPQNIHLTKNRYLSNCSSPTTQFLTILFIPLSGFFNLIFLPRKLWLTHTRMPIIVLALKFDSIKGVVGSQAWSQLEDLSQVMVKIYNCLESKKCKWVHAGWRRRWGLG